MTPTGYLRAYIDADRQDWGDLERSIDAVLATIDRLTKERDEALAEADPELLTIAWMDGSHRSAKAARDEIKRLTTRLSAMQEAVDEAYKAAMGDNPCAVVQLLRPFATKPEPEVDPLVVIAREMTLLDGVVRTNNQKDAIRAGRAGTTASEDFYDRLRTALAARGGRVVFDGREG